MLLVSTAVYIVIPAVIILGVICYFLIFKKENKENQGKDKNKLLKTEDINVALIDKYMYRKEIEFYYFLQSILQIDKVVFPKVGVDNILIPTTSKVAYNNIMSKYVDFVIFDEQTMKPLLVIDVYDNSYNDEILSQQEPLVSQILQETKLPVISILIKGNYDKAKIKEQIYSIIYPQNHKNEE